MRTGYVAIIGRPNVGKSTLLNALIGEKISIISPKPQTTRWQIKGIKTNELAQIIYIDTPGIHYQQKKAMNRYLNRVASSVVHDVDVLVFIVDVTEWNQEDDMVLKKLNDVTQPVILVLNKVDLIKDKALLLPTIERLKDKFNFAHIIPISALKDKNIDALEKEIIELLPQGDLLFPADQLTDKSIRFLSAEIIREKVIMSTEEELPYATSVEIEEFKEGEKLVEISAIIWVERQGQKVIVIGKGGERLKVIGTKARREIEKLVDNKVFLRLWVKVREHWTDDDKALRMLGYE